MVVWYGWESLIEGMRGRLNHVTDPHDAGVDLERAHCLQEESVET